MKKSTSLKEFSTTPTVSYMLSKDGHNLAGQQQQPARTQTHTAPVPREKPKQQQQQPAADADDAMYEME